MILSGDNNNKISCGDDYDDDDGIAAKHFINTLFYQRSCIY